MNLSIASAASTPRRPNGMPRLTGLVDRFRTTRPDLLVYIAGVLVITAVARVHHFIPGLHVLRPISLAMLIGLIAWGANNRGWRGLNRLDHPLGRIMLFLVIWAAIGIPLAVFPGASFNFVKDKVLSTVVLVFLLAVSIRSVSDVMFLIRVYVVGAAIYGLLAADSSAFRGLGEGSYDANDAAMYMVGGVPLALLCMQLAKGWRKLIYVALLVPMVQAFSIGGSRGAFLAFAAVLLYTITFFRSTRIFVRLGFLALVIGVGVTAGNEYYLSQIKSIANLNEDYNATEVTGRKGLWTRGVGYMLSHPITGLGVSNFPFADGNSATVRTLNEIGIGTTWAAPHSSWVEAGSEMGVPGLIAFVSGFIIPMAIFQRRATRLRKLRNSTRRQEAAVCEAMVCHLLALAVAGTFLTQAWGAFVWVAWALCLGLLKVFTTEDRSMSDAVTKRNNPVAPPRVRYRFAASRPR
ncbi:MAG: O-antigen ligase family protein [Gemmatimonadales bacterium]